MQPSPSSSALPDPASDQGPDPDRVTPAQAGAGADTPAIKAAAKAEPPKDEASALDANTEAKTEGPKAVPKLVSVATPVVAAPTAAKPADAAPAATPAVAAPAVAKPAVIAPVAAKLADAAPTPEAVPPAPAKPADAGSAVKPAVTAAKPAVLAPAAVKPAAAKPPLIASIRPVAPMAQLRPRHHMIVLSFVIVVFLPILVAATYLWAKATDQYASTVGFSVRREEASAALDVLGSLTGLSKSSSSDTDILYEFLRSQKLVDDLDAELNLRSNWSKPQSDPVFAFNPAGSAEDLLDYWRRMVRTSYDGSTGLIEVRVLAFTPDDATTIAQAVLDESSRMINQLSAVAREDAVRYAREELTVVQERLRAAREAITAFRVKNQIVDPTTDFQTQAGLIGILENRLADAQIEVELLSDSAATDPRLIQANRRIEVIEARIASERSKVGTNGAGGDQKDYAELAADYERLAVDREFAERAYVAALATYDSAVAESQRKNRYLAAHIMPTKAETSRYPERFSLLGLLALFLFLAWAIGTLVVYSLKDRR